MIRSKYHASQVTYYQVAFYVYVYATGYDPPIFWRVIHSLYDYVACMRCGFVVDQSSKYIRKHIIPVGKAAMMPTSKERRNKKNEKKNEKMQQP